MVSGGEKPSRRFGRPGTSTERDSITPEELRSLAPSKYGAKRTHVPALNRTFASKHEATVAVGLALRQEMGEIALLHFQERYPLRVNGVLVATYVADFTYVERHPDEYRPVVADAKGYPTPVYRLKKKLMKAVHGIEIVEL
jgi:hypothetical protein